MVLTPLTFAKLAAVAFMLHSELSEWASLPAFSAVLKGSGPVLSANANDARPSLIEQSAAYKTAAEKPGAGALAPRLNQGPFALARSVPVDPVIGEVRSISESPGDASSIH